MLSYLHYLVLALLAKPFDRNIGAWILLRYSTPHALYCAVHSVGSEQRVDEAAEYVYSILVARP